LIKYKGGEVALNDYLSALKKIPVSERPRFQTIRQLSDKIGVWIRDELLLKEALKHKLQNHPTVQKEVKEINENQCYYFLIQKEMESITIPENVTKYFKENDKKEPENLPNMRHFHTIQEWLWWKAQTNLHKRLINDKTFIKINYDELKRENSRIDWKNRIRMMVVQNPS